MATLKKPCTFKQVTSMVRELDKIDSSQTSACIRITRGAC